MTEFKEIPTGKYNLLFKGESEENEISVFVENGSIIASTQDLEPHDKLDVLRRIRKGDYLMSEISDDLLRKLKEVYSKRGAGGIYFIQMDDPYTEDYILKVGLVRGNYWSVEDSIEKRLKSLRVYCPFELKIYRYIKADDSVRSIQGLEKRIHEILDEFEYVKRLEGEWFCINRSYINEVLYYISEKTNHKIHSI
jgi:hypothetical protein